MKRHNVLCGCGWGQLGMLESEIPQHCPVCNFNLWVLYGGVIGELWERAEEDYSERCPTCGEPIEIGVEDGEDCLECQADTLHTNEFEIIEKR